MLLLGTGQRGNEIRHAFLHAQKRARPGHRQSVYAVNFAAHDTAASHDGQEGVKLGIQPRIPIKINCLHIGHYIVNGPKYAPRFGKMLGCRAALGCEPSGCPFNHPAQFNRIDDVGKIECRHATSAGFDALRQALGRKKLPPVVPKTDTTEEKIAA